MNPAERDPFHFAPFLQQPLVGIRPPARHHLQESEIHSGSDDADQCQQHVVLEHHDGVKDDHDQVENRPGQLAGQQVGHLIAVFDAVADLARVALREEFDRKAQDVPEELAG